MIDLSPATKAPSVGVLLVGGFLGAGKTTLLRRLVRDPRIGPRLAVLVNELGALGVDGDLIRAERDTDALRTVQLDSGCLCCTLKGELGQALEELAAPTQGAPPAQIVVELSGAALASEVHFQISTQALSASYHADGLVCLVDAHQAPRWAVEASELFSDQLARADLVLLSKLDLATPEEVDATRRLLSALAPGARVVPCAHGDVDPELLLGMPYDAMRPEAPHRHVHGLRGETIALPAPVQARTLEAFLDEHAASFFRIKGIVDLTGDEAHGGGTSPCLVQCVGDQIDVSPFADAGAARRLTFIAPADSPAWGGAPEAFLAGVPSRLKP